MSEALIYLHGFNSASLDAAGHLLTAKNKLQLLKKFCDQHDYRFLAPNLDYQNPKSIVTSLTQLDQQFDSEGCDVTFIGTSLGGFFAEYLAMQTKACAIMINPATSPATSLTRYIGSNKNFVTEEVYTWTQQNCDALLSYEKKLEKFPGADVPRTVLVDLGDELFDSYATVKKYQGRAHIITYEGGSHHFEHMQAALPEIYRTINRVALPLT